MAELPVVGLGLLIYLVLYTSTGFGFSAPFPLAAGLTILALSFGDIVAGAPLGDPIAYVFALGPMTMAEIGLARKRIWDQRRVKVLKREGVLLWRHRDH
jgi:hypothetical protein